ncbi:acyltransferase family protein [Sphingobacterium litopenaei]|uniref:Acyltransferase n=1 Tax=Sphingobacterium litopenaei TaxID=2763500 RepID=A0ABR7YEP7_9SPHI|nr:acyltransferase family protein [Sphingobacterium litopenaei]MBD1429761.1 acyltransferase [Sphingobacterium litopenaei]
MKFRYDIGALRAFAVLVVVLFHYGVSGFEGGYAGVDIFFVISGYLMTKIILTSFAKDNFTLKSFYKRRFDRIVPALIILILLIVFYCMFLYLPKDYEQVNKNGIWSSLFLSNFYYALNSSYFHPSAQSNVFLHTWSLSVEWQFYMLYPLLLLPLKKAYLNNKNKFNIIFLSILFSSFILMLYFNYLMPDKYSKYVFYGTPFRAWEMFLGGIGFLYEKNVKESISKKYREIICVVLFILLFSCIYFLSEGLLWPSIYTVFPALITLGIILLNVNSKLLEFKIVQFFGKISYSLYLWHWPLIVIYGYRGEYTLNGVFCLFLFAILISCVSYYYVENKAYEIGTRKIFFISVCSISIMLILLYFNPLEKKYSKEIINLTEFRDNYDRDSQFNIKCHSDNLETLKKNGCLIINNRKKNILLTGDSHAAQYYLSLSQLIDTSQYNIVQITTSGALPLLNTKGAKGPKSVMNFVLMDYLPNNLEKFDLVLISAHWYNYKLRGYSQKEFVAEFKNLDKYMEGLNSKYLILGQSVFYRIPYPTSVALNYYYKENVNYINTDGEKLNNILKSSVNNYFDLYPMYFPELQITESPYFFDNDHFTLRATDVVVPIILKDISKRFNLNLTRRN